MFLKASLVCCCIIFGGPAFAQNGLYGDFDHDGKTDLEPLASVDYQKRIITLNNLDDDNRDKKPDSIDNILNGDDDRSDLAELRLVTKTAASAVLLQLSQDGAATARVFNAAGTMILGPGSAEHMLTAAELSAAKAAGQKFFVEGLEFAAKSRLTVEENGVPAYGATVEVAPLLLLPHTQAMIDNRVVQQDLDDDGASRRFVDKFKAAVSSAKAKPVVVRSHDVWMQDELEWGVSQAPYKTMHVAVHMRRNRELAEQVKALLGPNTGYYGYFSTIEEHSSLSDPGLTSGDLDSGGNLEVTPPVPGHPFGRVYFGGRASKNTARLCYERRQMHPLYKKFFERQGLQEPIEFNTDWLTVGHIDEISTFVPTKSRPKGFVLLIASPALALSLLDKSFKDATVLPQRYGQRPYLKKTYGQLLNWKMAGRTLRDFNKFIDAKIFGVDHKNPATESVVGTFKRELGLDAADIIEMPILFYSEGLSEDNEPDPACNSKQFSISVGAVSPGLVNLSSMGSVSLIPDPFLVPFKTYVEGKMRGIGQRVIWIDDWDMYHVAKGEVHCGSNGRREPFTKKWWQP